jgi:hypothetical protein
MQHVEVRHVGERHLEAVEQPARLHHRHVEGLPVVRDDEIRTVEEIGHRREQRTLGGEAGEQKLPHLERAQVEISASDKKRHCPGSAAQSSRLQVDENRPPST